jgi:hypothetical protein
MGGVPAQRRAQVPVLVHFAGEAAILHRRHAALSVAKKNVLASTLRASIWPSGISWTKAAAYQ